MLPLPLALLALLPQSALPSAPRPIAFVANAGQWPAEHRFRAECGPLTLACERDGVRIFLAGADGAACALRLAFTDDPHYAGPTAGPALPGAHHFLRGADPAAWRTASAHASVIYEEILQGIGLRLRDAPGRIEYDVLLAPGADLDSFTMLCEGADALRLAPDGALLMLTAAGPLRHTPPRTWQITPDGATRPLASAFVLHAPDVFGFRVEGADPALPTVVDPGLEWSTFLGGSLADLISDVAVTPQGDLIVTGWTLSPNFPVTVGIFNASGEMDGFISKFSADGTQLLWSTIVGGSGDDDFYRIAMDSVGRPVISAYTESPDFPTTPGAWDRQFSGTSDGVVFRTHADGSGLDWSTFLGGSRYDELFDVALAPGDEPVVVGSTESPDFPRVGTAAAAMSGFPGADATVTRLSADGTQVLMSTCLHGAGPGLGTGDLAASVRLLPGGSTVVVAGDTEDATFQVTPGTLGPIYGGNEDTFLGTVDLATGARIASTFVGGSEEEEIIHNGLEVDAAGNVYLVTWTESPDYPMPAAGYDLSYADRGDLALTVVTSALNGSGPGAPLHGTFLGTPGDEEFGVIRLAPDGSVLVAGSTNHASFPVTPGAWDTVFNGGAGRDDTFVARFDATLTTLTYSTFLGGDGQDLPQCLLAVGADAVIVGGATQSATFPVRAGAYDASFNGFADGFLARLDLRPCPVLAVQPDPLRRGQAASFRVSELTPGERAYVAYSLTGVGFGSAPPPLGGLRLDLIGAVALLGQTPPANAAGVATLALTVPPGAPLVTLWTQAAVARGVAGSHSVKSNVVARAVAP